MLEKISFIRHGEKMSAGDKETIAADLQELDIVDQEEWKEAIQRLGIEENPEIRPANIIKIREVAGGLFLELPDRALVLFASTMTPRTRLSADLLSTELYKLIQQQGKDITIAYAWQPESERIIPENPINLVDGPAKGPFNRISRKVLAKMNPEVDQDKYLHTGGGHGIKNEDDFVAEAIRLDLAEGKNSSIKRRIARYREQIENLKEWSEGDRPVYFVGVGHHMSLIPLDMYFNDTKEYLEAEIPQPLDRWSYDIDK